MATLFWRVSIKRGNDVVSTIGNFHTRKSAKIYAKKRRSVNNDTSINVVIISPDGAEELITTTM